MSLNIPATYIGTPDASLEIEPDVYGDSYTMTLRAADGHVIASASGFRPGAGFDFATDDDDERAGDTAATFGAFMGHALEDAEFAAEWDVLAEDASDWADALTLMDEQEN